MSTDPVTIGRYRVVRRLGGGGMGNLYLAQDPELERLVAIKLLKDDLADDAELEARFSREARAAARLRHPNIVTVFDFGVDAGRRPFIAMEYIPGESLADVIRRRDQMALARKLSIIGDLCSGLAHAHRSGVVHRDVKPGNIMVDPDGTVKIVDFGIARLGDSTMTHSGVLVGTLNYMAPEQLMGGRVDHRADIFAVGVVAYELVAYRKAFPGSFQDGVSHRICNQAPEPMGAVCPGLDPEVERVVLKAIEKDASARWQDLLDMRQAMDSICRRLSAAVAPTVVLPALGLGPVATPAPTPPRRDVPARLLRLRREQIESHLRAAEQELEQGNYQAAIESGEQALAIEPDDEPALAFVEKVRALADIAEARRLLAESIEHLQRHELTQAEIAAARAAGFLAPTTPEDLRRDLQRLQADVERARERARMSRQALNRARQRLEQHAYESAIRAADDALAVDPTLDEAHELIREAQAAIDEGKRLDLAAQAIVQRARERFAGGDPTGALALLAGHTPPHDLVRGCAEEIRKEIEAERQRAEAERRRRRAKAGELASSARRAITEGRFGAALADLQAAAALDPDLPELTELGTRAEAGRRAQAEADEAAARETRKRRDQIDRALKTARACLKTSDLKGARDAVDVALRVDAGDQAARAIAVQLAQAEAEHRRQIEQVVSGARAALGAGDFKAAVNALENLQRTDTHPELVPLLSAARQQLAAAQAAVRQREAIEATVVRARERLARKDFAGARAELEKTLRLDTTDADSLAAIERIGAEVERARQADEDERRTAAQRVEEQRKKAAQAEEQRRKDAEEARRRRREAAARAVEESARRTSDTAPTAAAEEKPPQPAGSAPQPTVVLSTIVRAGKSPSRVWLVAALLVALIAVAGAIFLFPRQSQQATPQPAAGQTTPPAIGRSPGSATAPVPDRAPAAAPPEAVAPPPATETGILVVDATPWASVEITDANGKRQALPQAHTPLWVELPIGRYSVTLRGEQASPQTGPVTVTRGRPQRFFRQFRTVDAAEYFKKLGFGERQ